MWGGQRLILILASGASLLLIGLWLNFNLTLGIAFLIFGIGPLIFGRIAVSGRLAETTGLYALLCSFVVVSILALRKKLDAKVGVPFIILYLLAYATLYI